MNEQFSQGMLRELKKNPHKLTDRQKFSILLSIVAEHPNALDIFKNMQFIDEDMVKELQLNHSSGWGAAKRILDSMEIKTPNSIELSIKYRGYAKPITAIELDQLIDLVETQMQYREEMKNISNGKANDGIEVQEEKTTLGELIR